MQKNQQEIIASQSTIYFYIRQKLWNTVVKQCNQYYQSFTDPFFIFWQGFGLMQQGQINQAINQLTNIQTKKEIQWATVLALIYYHGKCQTVDRDAVNQLKMMENDSRQLGSDKAAVMAAYFFLYLENAKKANDIIEPYSFNNSFTQTCAAWIDLTINSDNPRKALESFQKIIEDQGQNSSKPVETLMGITKAAELSKDFKTMIQTINEVIVLYPTFSAALNEKAKLLMIVGEWEDCLEMTQQNLYEDDSNILSLKMMAFYTIAREGDIETGCEKLQSLFQTIERQESSNANLFYSISQLFSRISGRNSKILGITTKIISKCRKISPLNADFAIQLAVQFLMLQEYETAFKLFQEAAALDQAKVESLSGMILCRIHQGMVEDAEKQIEFMNEIQVTGGRSSELAFLEALLESKKANQSVQRQKAAVQFIDEALKLHISMTQTLVPGFDFFIKLNPDFLLSLAQAYLRNIGMKEMLQGKEMSNSSVGKGSKLLDSITKQIPGLITAYLLSAKAKLALGDANEAMKAITKVLDLDQKNQDAYIVQALVFQKHGNFSSAMNSLDQAVSNNFLIRENPLFMLVKGEVQFTKGDFVQALKTTEAAFDIPGIKDKNSIKATKITKEKSVSILSFSDQDRCSIFLLYAQCLAANKRNQEAQNIVQSAIAEFMGTPEEVNVLIANSEIAVQSGDIKKAISILKAVSKDSPYFVQARQILADVYLTNLKDRRQYARCYAELIENNPSFENYYLLGDAMMKINEPEDAANSYEEALQLKPDNEDIVRDLGRALCQTHDYARAIKFYEEALKKNSKRTDLLLDLGKLYILIQNYQKADECLQPELFLDDFNAQTSDTLRRGVECCENIAQLNLKKMPPGELKPNDQVRQCLKKAIKLQRDLIEQVQEEGENSDKERVRLAEIYVDLAKYTADYEKNEQMAINILEEAAQYWQDSEKIIEHHCQYLMRLGDKTSVENKCNMLLRIHPNNDYASVTLAELMLQKDDYDKAIEQFKKLLEQKPNNYGLLSKVVDFLRRAGQLGEVKKYIQRAEASTANTNDPGLCFCRGLYNQYNRNPREALNEFNQAKKSSQYAEESLVHLIDIYLNPDQELYFNNVEETALVVDEDNLRACDILLREMQTRASYQRYIVMESYVGFIGQYKNALETGIQNLTEMLKSNQEYVPGLLALSIGQFIQKKQTDAKNILKVLWKRNYTSDFGEDLERSWLLYADSFVAIQKYDNAEEILKKCLKYNNLCAKAEEYMGLIKEKEEAYVDAALHYEKAYKLTNNQSPSIAFRLAFNYLKAKRYVDCIDICKIILETYPDYPQIEKEILVKARSMLK